MVDIYGSHFEYGGVSSRQYDLVIANLNTSRMVRMCVHGEGVTLFNKASNKFTLVGEDNSDTQLVFDIEIVTSGGRCLERSECRTIEKWLFRCNGYKKLYFDMADDTFGAMYEYIDGVRYRNYLNCRFINPEKLEGNGGIIGYKATLEADSNMFWQDAITKQYIVKNDTADGRTDIFINIDTDASGYIYPKVNIVTGNSGGDILICNHTDDSTRLTKFVDVLKNATITMKGELNYVSGQYYEKLVHRNFIRLLGGENKLSIQGDVSTIEFEYSARRMM